MERSKTGKKEKKKSRQPKLQLQSCRMSLLPDAVDELPNDLNLHPSFIPTGNTLLENLLSVRVTHSNDINMPRYQLEPGICDERNIKVVFRKSAYSLMSRVTTSLNSIVTTTVNRDTYHQSPLMDKKESILKVQE